MDVHRTLVNQRRETLRNPEQAMISSFPSLSTSSRNKLIPMLSLGIWPAMITLRCTLLRLRPMFLSNVHSHDRPYVRTGYLFKGLFGAACPSGHVHKDLSRPSLLGAEREIRSVVIPDSLLILRDLL